MSDDIHEVYAVRYAEHARKRSENYIFGDDTTRSAGLRVYGGDHKIYDNYIENVEGLAINVDGGVVMW